jgi:hypothetical protein
VDGEEGEEEGGYVCTFGFQPVQTAAAPLSWQALLDTQRRMSTVETAAARLARRQEVSMLDGLMVLLGSWRESCDVVKVEVC